MIQHFGQLLGQRIIQPQEPIVAWRAWRVYHDHTSVRSWWDPLGRVTTAQPRLGATYPSHGYWPARAATVATCRAKEGKAGCHGGLARHCTCGIWASKRLENLAAHGAAFLWPVGLIGRVDLWGFAWEYEHGFRASIGRIKECWTGSTTLEARVERLAEDYGVPIHPGMPTVAEVPISTDAVLVGHPPV